MRLYGQLFAYLPVGPVVWAQGYRIGTVPGTDCLLLENRFQAGGPTTVRGFEQNELGPQTTAGDSLGGQAVVVLNQELRFPLFGKLKGGVFWDAGNVWQTSDELDPLDLRQAVGAGLRYTFPFGPVRVEYAWIRRTGRASPPAASCSASATLSDQGARRTREPRPWDQRPIPLRGAIAEDSRVAALHWRGPSAFALLGAWIRGNAVPARAAGAGSRPRRPRGGPPGRGHSRRDRPGPAPRGRGGPADVAHHSYGDDAQRRIGIGSRCPPRA